MASRGASIKSTSINGVKLYSLSDQRSTAAWLNPKKQRALRKDRGYQQRVDLIQDLSFETATTKIKATPDGEYVIASGIYPPQIKVYELKQLSMKFERHLISEIVNFQVLDEDYSKIAFLCSDRSVCLHAKYGSHYSLRIPRMGRDIAYDCWSCDLLCAASSPDLYRINLEQGRFLSSLSSQSPAINVVSRSNIHGLVACGGEDGAVECFDMRKKSSVGRISTASSPDDIGQEVTALQFDESQGYLMAVGSSTGKISIYDLRMSNPIRVKDHMYGSPILGIKWHQTLNFTEPKLITADSHIVRIWDPNTEEMEENSQTTIYDDYKFLTKEDLERLNLTNLIGTTLLRAYMHGYFIDYRLYKKAQALADPFAYEAYREKRKQEKIEADRGSRITVKRKLPKVNRDLAARLLKEQEAEDVDGENVDDENMTKKKKKNKGISSDILKDERFAIMFENKDFEIDEESQEYLSLHPQSSKKQRSLIEEHFEPVMEDEEQSDSDASMDSQTMGDDSDSDGNKLKNSRRMRLYEVKDERHAEAFLNRKSLAKEDALPLGERVALLEQRQPKGGLNGVKFGAGGSREISFFSRSSKKQQHRDEEEPKAAKRRGVQSLGLKPSKGEFYAMGGRGGGRGKSRGGRRGRR